MNARNATVAIIGLALLLRILLWLRGPAALDALTLLDDTYLVLHLARSLAEGLGPFYGLAATNGFQPLYTFAVAPAFLVWPDDPDAPIRAALALNVLLDLATLAALLVLVRRTTRGRVAVPGTALLWAVHPYVLRNALNGMETALAALMLVLLLLALERWRHRPPGPPDGARFGALLGLAALARIDLLLIAPVALFVALHAHRARPARAIGAIAAAACAAAVVQAPWLAASWHWTGTLLPVSGEAVRYMELANVDHAPGWSSFYRPMLERAGATVLRWNSIPLLGLAAVLALAARRGGTTWTALVRTFAPAAPAFGFALLLFAAYALHVFGHWFFFRYLFPIAIPVAWAFALAIDTLECGPPGARDERRRAAAPAAAALVVAAGLCVVPPFARLWGPPPPGWGYRPIGEWARGAFAPGTRVGGSQTGAIGYFARDLVPVNLDGVVHRDALEAMRAGRAIPFIRAHGVRWLVWQDDIDWMLRETDGARGDEIVLVTRIDGLRSMDEPWFLYEVAGVAGQSDAPMAPPGAGPSAASE